MKLGSRHLEDEVIITIAMIIMAIFSFLAISQDAGIVLFMMVMSYFVAVSSKTVHEVEVIRSERDARNGLKVISIIFATVAAWIIINSFIFGLSQGQFTAYSTEMFKAVYIHSNIPILATDPVMIQLVWGFIFPIIESMFFLSVVLMVFHRVVFKNWELPKRITRKNVGRVAWVAMLVGATASLIHLNVRQASDWALLGDFVFFSISSLVVYKTRQLLEAAGVHSIINNLVLLIGGG